MTVTAQCILAAPELIRALSLSTGLDCHHQEKSSWNDPQRAACHQVVAMDEAHFHSDVGRTRKNGVYELACRDLTCL
ncbi:hypothetical protein [Phyllobacterium phragmitis]|uniref:hypothetical protein n=1 Tax=Phyllobacterium phragmitis TaxID=2670329 RepID=UPI0011B1F3F6|nr:hypothetical protein [Phyllobacterium phragmitis]